MSLLAAILPLAALGLVMAVRWPRAGLPLSPQVSLPMAAGLAFLLWLGAPGRAAAGGLDALLARVIEGLLASLTPLAIVFGAIGLFTTLDRSGAMDVLTRRLRRLTPDPLLQVLLVGWAFSALVEGLSGFGTPAALAAPILVGLGFPPIRAAACLILNTIPVVFGAVGTPIWFGLGEIDLTRPELLEIGQRAAIVQMIIAPPVVVLALRLLLPWRAIRRRLLAVLAVTTATTAASFAVAHLGVEFPSIAGGLAGLAAAWIAARFARDSPVEAPDREPPPADTDDADDDASRGPRPSLAAAAMPFLATIVLLALTRIEPLGLRELLQSRSPAASMDLGGLGTLRISALAVVELRDILGTDIRWSMALLYVPFILPFVLVALASARPLGLSARQVAGVWRTTTRRLLRPAIALGGALVLVKLMMHGGTDAPVVRIGDAAAALVERVEPRLWPAVAPLLGALGSFFSGSATVSNLTFAPVQVTVAEDLGLDRLTVLAMQATGGAIGNMVCIHNLVAVAAVLGLTERGGRRDDGSQPAEASDPAESAEREPVSAMLRFTAGPLAVAAAGAAAASWLL